MRKSTNHYTETASYNRIPAAQVIHSTRNSTKGSFGMEVILLLAVDFGKELKD